MTARATRCIYHWTLRAGAVLAAGYVLMTACTPPGLVGDQVEKTYVGALHEKNALIALLTDGQQVVAYVCDGIEGSETVSGWFEGQVNGEGRFELSPVSGTSYEGTGAERTLSGTIGGDSATGALALGDGTSIEWTAQTAAAETAAGLYLYHDDEHVAALIVTNDHLAVGLSRSTTTGWTQTVTLTKELEVSDKQTVQFGNTTTDAQRVKSPETTLTRIKPAADPPPTVGNGTLMVMVTMDRDRASGFRYWEVRPDPIGLPTVQRTKQLSDPNRPKGALEPFMQVQVLDQSGAVISGQFIPDPLHPFIEVPADGKGGDIFWTAKQDKEIASFLVAVPNIKGFRQLRFTRFTGEDAPIDTGTIDLFADATKSKQIGARLGKHYHAADAEYATIMSNGPSAGRMDLLILADGFQDNQADRDTFNQKVWELLTYLWAIPIYNELQTAINVHTAFVPSVSSGVVALPNAAFHSPFESYFNCNNIDRLICLGSDGQSFAYEVAKGAPGNYGAGSVDTIAVLVNDTRYGGGGGAILTASIDTQSPEIFSHEFGHAVIDLADEYEEAYNTSAEVAARLKANVSSPVSNRNDLKWIDLVHPSTAIPTTSNLPGCVRTTGCSSSTLPTGTVGMFEGAGYTACSSYRPTTECQMRCYVGFFCEVCRKAYRDVLGGMATPLTVDVYMRDNSLDVGSVPSPTNIEDPPGSGNRVKPWHSVDIRVDAPPFGTATDGRPHENPIAGVTNRVYVTVHNRGTDPSPAVAQTQLYFAPATGGAPPFPGGEWQQIGLPQAAMPPGQGGSSTVMFIWNAPANLPPHTCLIATADAGPADPLPALSGGLSALVRNSNNITWKNLHVVRIPEIRGEISNYEGQVLPIVLRIEAAGVPEGTVFDFNHEDIIGTFQEFNPADFRQMDVLNQAGNNWTFARNNIQQWLQLRGDLPPAPADGKDPFVSNFLLKINLPGGTPVGVEYQISIDQYAIDAGSNILGDPIGGNTYTVKLE